jgi:hypothetical protein
MLLIAIFVELRVVSGRSRKRAGSPPAVLCRGLDKNGMGAAWAHHGKSESDTAALCKSNGEDTF